MTLTKLALEDVQHSTDLRAALEALLAGSPPQKFTPPESFVVEYRHETGHDTRDLLGTQFLWRVLARK